MSFRTILSGAAVALSMAVAFTGKAHAQAATPLSYGTHYYYNFGGEAFQQATNAPLSFDREFGPVTTPSAILPGSRVFGIADIGQLKSYTQLSAYQTAAGQADYYGINYVGFTADVIFDTGTPGQSGIATFAINVDGTLSNRLQNGFSNYAPQLAISDAVIRTNGIGDCTVAHGYCDVIYEAQPGQVYDAAATRSYSYIIPFVSGQVTQISVELETGGFVRAYGPGYIYSLADFSHTLNWGGLVSATAQDGSDLTSTLGITAANGFDFRSAISSAAVPEPATWALMLAGFGIVGRAMRRRPKVRVSFA